MPLENLNATTSSTASSTASSEEGSLNMTGSRLARFVNNYSPAHDKPSEHLVWNSELYLDDELSDKLAEDRRRNVQHHLTADKAFKEYFASRMKNASMMRH